MSLYKRGRISWVYFYIDGVRHQQSPAHPIAVARNRFSTSSNATSIWSTTRRPHSPRR